METKRIAFNMSAKKADLMARTEKISYKGKTLDMWFAINLYRQYVATEGPTNFDVFLNALEKVDGWRVIPFSNKEYTVVSKNERIDSKFIEEIVTDKLANITFTLTSSEEEEDEGVRRQDSGNKGDGVRIGGAAKSVALKQQGLKRCDDKGGPQDGGKKGGADTVFTSTRQKDHGKAKSVTPSSEKRKDAKDTISDKSLAADSRNQATKSTLRSAVAENLSKAFQGEKTTCLGAPKVNQKGQQRIVLNKDESTKKESDNSSPQKQDKGGEPRTPTKKKMADIDDFFSDDEMEFVQQPAKKFVSVFSDGNTDEKAQGENRNREDPVQRLRAGIIDAFGEAFVIPVAGFYGMMQEKHGMAIDYKKAPCKIPFHRHSSLSKLLGCYNDVLELKVFRNAYAVLKVPAATKRMERLEAAFLFPTDDRLFKLGIEVLVTSMFPIKVLIPMEDCIKLVSTFYRKLSELNVFSEAFITRLKSPNITPLQSGTIRSVSIIPFGSEKYKRWCKDEDHDRVQCLESLVRKSEKIMLSDVSTTSSGLFGDNSEALKIADLNIPKSLQLERDPQIASSCSVGSSLWMYLRHSVNFDNKETFFFP